MPVKFQPAIIATALTLFALAGCRTAPPLKSVAELPPGVAGIWQSNGYGYVLDASGEYPRLFHYTPEFCIEDIETAAIFTHYLKPENLAYENGGGAFYFSGTLESYKMQLRAIEQRPQTCGLAVSSGPVTVFESFVSYMQKHYAFFDLYGVNWASATQSARQNVSQNMSDAELYDVITDLMKPMKDGHLELIAKVDGQQKTFKPGQSSLGDALARMAVRDGLDKQRLSNNMMNEYWMKGIKKDILVGRGKMAANEAIQYGIVSGDIGYLAVAMEAGYAGKGEGFEEADLAVLNKTLDDAISTFNTAPVKAVIVDLSINFGGYDFISREIASRFVSKPSLIYTKFAADSTIRTPDQHFIQPHQGARFEGPVVLVTSDVTVSAGEIMTMAFRSQPNVTHVGEATRGALSDVLKKQLPNGWELELSNEVYHDHKGEFWEGKGIPPHVPIQIFDPENPFVGHVAAIGYISTRIDQGDFMKPPLKK